MRNTVLTLFILSAKNEFLLPEKSQKLGNFGHKNGPQYYEGNFWYILIDFPCVFVFFFLAKQPQTMLTVNFKEFFLAPLLWFW